MNKFKNIFFDNVADVAVVVGSAVGVGLISGKEAQVFIGSPLNALIFFAAFFAILTVFREFCRKNAVFNTVALSNTCFKRFAVAFRYALCCCAFVCVVTCLAGVEQCLSDVAYLSNLPLYAICVAALSAFVMIKGLSALKICNVISVAMTAALFVALALSKVNSTSLTTAPMPYMPVAYALFSFTMSLSLTCKLGAKSSKVQNVVRTAISAAIVAVLLIVTMFLADFSQSLPTLSAIENPFIKAYATLTIALACMCSVVGCALPVCELFDNVICDKTVSSFVVFGLACAFSMFGFDFLVRVGYVFVAVIGAVVVISACIPQLRNTHN